MAINLKTIQESQNGSNQKDENINVEIPKGGFDTRMPHKGERVYVVFKLVKKRRGRVYIDGICDNVMNPKTKKAERIWLLNGANSIWSSELSEQLKDKDWVNRARRSLIFEDGLLRLHVDEEATAIDFARHNKKNVHGQRSGSGKWDFYEYDAAEEAKSKLAREDKEIEMMLAAKEMNIEKVKKLAAFLGVSFADVDGFPIGDDGIRTGLIRRAKQDPYTFEKYLDSEEVSIAWLVKKAIMEAKIDLTGQSGNAIWAGGKGFIAKIPAGRKPYEYLTELAMTNSDEGKRFKEQLQTIT